jgi:hypothetical protein
VISSGSVTSADALMRLVSEGLDGLDPALARTGRRGTRSKVVLHHDVDPTGALGPGQLHLGAVVPDTVSRHLSCDADVLVALYVAGTLVGINPTQRGVSHSLRLLIERRDQGCAHPLCTQTRRLHIHHILHWADGGLTVPFNLVCLCPTHHRQIHEGDLRVTGSAEDGTLRFYDSRGSPIEPPDHGPPPALRLDGPSPFTPPLGERPDPRWFDWN